MANLRFIVRVNRRVGYDREKSDYSNGVTYRNCSKGVLVDVRKYDNGLSITMQWMSSSLRKQNKYLMFCASNNQPISKEEQAERKEQGENQLKRLDSIKKEDEKLKFYLIGDTTRLIGFKVTIKRNGKIKININNYARIDITPTFENHQKDFQLIPLHSGDKDSCTAYITKKAENYFKNQYFGEYEGSINIREVLFKNSEGEIKRRKTVSENYWKQADDIK